MFGVFFAILLLILVFVGIASVAVDGGKEVSVKTNSVLHIKLDYPILDRSPADPFQNFDFQKLSPDKSIGLNEILKNINNAKADDKIKGLYLDLTSVAAGYATLKEIRNALVSFGEDSSKFIVAYSEIMSQKAYFLASVADEIYLNPQGYMQLMGIGTSIPFFKGMLDKLDVEAQIIRHGKFKSAVEPFILEKMSDASKEQTEKFIFSIWDNIVADIASSRGKTVDELNLIADSLLADNAEEALKLNLVDKLYFKDEVMTILKEKLNLEEDKKINFVSLAKYGKGKPQPKEKGKGLIRDRIAVIYAQGGIVMGEGEADEIGSEKISKAIRKARKDDKVKAIVLRVNSGGGSALASDIILREMELAKEIKPVIASMGDVAASGGYYISCMADTIVASNVTITGSIGVLGVLMNAQDFLKNKLGITFDGVKSNPHSDLGDPTRPLSAFEKKAIQKEIVRIYDVFISHVAAGRGLTEAQVDSIGQGRVWSGADALELGLVDVIGGLDKAIEIAAELAGLEDYKIRELPVRKDPVEQLISQLTGEAETRLIQYKLGDNYKYYKQLEMLAKMQGIQAIVPYDLNLN